VFDWFGAVLWPVVVDGWFCCVRCDGSLDGVLVRCLACRVLLVRLLLSRLGLSGAGLSLPVVEVCEPVVDVWAPIDDWTG
jgi:hypothetical protein